MKGGQYVYTDSAPIFTTSSDRLETKKYRKLVSSGLKQYEITDVLPSTVVIEENGIHITISVDCAELER